MQNPSYNVSDCCLFHYFHQLVLSLFLRLFQSNFSHIATNYCPMYFLLIIVLCNNNEVCRGSTLKLSLLLLYLHSQHKDPILLICLCRLFSVFASGLFLCICLCQAFSVFASSGHFVMFSVGWLCSLVVCVAPGAFLRAVYAGYHGYAFS